MDYPSDKADSLEMYVDKTFCLSPSARHLYHGLRWAERQQLGFCRPVIAGHRFLAEVAGLDKETVKKSLMELQTTGLCEVILGSPIKSDKKATEVRRYSLDEIKGISRLGADDAPTLARALTERAFWFDGKEVKPCWTVGRTGRVISSAPNFQGLAATKRIEGLRVGLKQGQFLVHADITSAEPTVIKHLLGIPFDRDLYREYASAIGVKRDEAKKPINTLSYCKDTLACFHHWPSAAQNALRDYALALADYKESLFVAAIKVRSITTLKGRSILAEKHQRIHPGKIMNWRIQGTIADIVNAACLNLLDEGWPVLPIHDAIYAVTMADKTDAVGAEIVNKARELGIRVQVKTALYPSE